MNKRQQKLFIADLLLAFAKHGIALNSPYDIENTQQDYLTHEALMPFFYAKSDGHKLDPVKEARKVLGLTG